ncbi:sugar transporter [Ancylomarina salipaludis]|uniref:Sugar transporter n=1 Tax=Ancylomarina salipaludis TaxID=2501299 RepID=A0A4Q1JPZ9_9BACT|nr:polysaccharide biosynthesis/export family protein [Ancylomarina salipaludis]RXQ97453.1 sugar transporter [Ancylomarina salipaludis]
MKFNRLIIFLLLSAMFVSCIPQKRTIYMRDVSGKKSYINLYTKAVEVTEAYTIQPRDYIYIRVLTPDEAVASLYNLDAGQMNMNTMGDPSSLKFQSYQVSDEGDIDFPYVGQIKVVDLTLKEVKVKMQDILKKHIDTFTLQVQLTNTQFTILGEVHSPGQYNMNKDQLTIFEAISLAGDLTIYGKRKRVRIVRPTTEGTKTINVDLTDLNLVDSQNYYIQPNDLIYVEPIKAKMFGFGETFSLGLVTSIISFFLLANSLK